MDKKRKVRTRIIGKNGQISPSLKRSKNEDNSITNDGPKDISKGRF